MALTPAETLQILDHYGFTGTPAESEYPDGIGSQHPYEIQWGSVRNPDAPREPTNYDAESQQNDIIWTPRRSEAWHAVGGEIEAAARRNRHHPPPDNVDALAYYLPYHYFGLDWGIYVPETSIFTIAGYIWSSSGHPHLSEKLAQALCRSALNILYLHEAFHHKVESFATRLEIARLQAVYRPYKEHIYPPLRNTDADLEEAIATAEMLTRLSERAYSTGIPEAVRQNTQAFVETWIPNLAPGYRTALSHRDPQSIWELQAKLASTGRPMPQPAADWGVADRMMQGLYNKDSVCFVLVKSHATPTIPWFDGVSKFVSLSTKRVAKLIEKEYGYVEQVGRGKGGHRYFTSETPGLRPITLPGAKRELSSTVLKSVTKTLGLPSVRELAARC